LPIKGLHCEYLLIKLLWFKQEFKAFGQFVLKSYYSLWFCAALILPCRPREPIIYFHGILLQFFIRMRALSLDRPFLGAALAVGGTPQGRDDHVA
jgi:hypothetical protein